MYFTKNASVFWNFIFLYELHHLDKVDDSSDNGEVEKLMLLSDDYIVYTGHNISTTIGSERVRNRYLRKKRIWRYFVFHTLTTMKLKT